MHLSLEDSISALYVCADILEYPTDIYESRILELSELTKKQYALFDMKEIEAEYIRLFSIEASKLKTVPFASWWLDGRIFGKSYIKISDFYKTCGYEIDEKVIKKPFDHISLMITFIAILAQEQRFEEIKKFAKFLTWLNDFANSLNNSTKIRYFNDAIEVTSKILTSFKERL